MTAAKKTGQFSFRGVKFENSGNWSVTITRDKKRHQIGTFTSFVAARAARMSAEREYYGTVFDVREIEVCGNHVKIPLHGFGGKFKGWTIVDLYDLEKVSAHNWYLMNGYPSSRFPGGLTLTLHRWLMFGMQKSNMCVDHIDGDRLNNRRSNLRICSQADNSKNQKMHKNNTSGIKGVTRFNEKWLAQIMVNRKSIYLGVFDDVSDARNAYDNASMKFHGEFASPNSHAVGLE